MTNRIDGIDYLRATMSIFVVVWHMGGGGQSLVFSKEEYLNHVFTISDFINFHLLLLAVPTFIFLSIYLYASKPTNIVTFKKQLTRVFILLSFWPVAFTLCKSGYLGLIDIIPNSFFEFIYLALRAGKTIYYFFTSLIICLFTVHFFIKLGHRIQLLILLLFMTILAALPQLTITTGFYSLSAYWNPLNFIPLSFAAVLFVKNQKYILKYRTRVILLSLALGALCAVFEWKYSVSQIFFLGQGYAIPAYTRTSIVFAVIVIFTLALDPRIRTHGAIKYMAKYSLALYCLHPFLFIPVQQCVAMVIQEKTIAIYISIMLVVVLSYCIATILKKYYLREGIIM